LVHLANAEPRKRALRGLGVNTSRKLPHHPIHGQGLDVFDSGVFELVLRLDGPTDGSVVIENVRFDDKAEYPPA
jgi:hypothetical protein